MLFGVLGDLGGYLAGNLLCGVHCRSQQLHLCQRGCRRHHIGRQRQDPNAQFDAFICQLSTNDASSAIPLGEISSSRNLEDFDTKTVLGALEYIIVYADTTWHCPVVFYTGTKYDSPAYGKMVEQLLKLQEKYEIGVIDLWDDAEMNQVSEEDYKLYMFDVIHPTQAGYLNWWTPKMEAYLYDYLGQ